MDRSLEAHLARFCGALREARVPVVLGDRIVGANALTWIDLGDPSEVRRALLAALRIRPADRVTFDALFAAWWRATPPRRAARPPRTTAPERRPARAPNPNAARETTPVALPEGPDGTRGQGWSPEALLRAKPFERWTERDLAALDGLLAALARRLATRRSRRLVPTRGRGTPDLRRSFRRMLATGAEPILLARRARPIERPDLVLLCDTSGSMDPHTKFLLSFAFSLGRAVRRLRVFAFNTTLTNVTPWLSRRALHHTLARLAEEVPDWSGGTRIGDCLAEFVRAHQPWVVGSRTVVVILSDGLDRGDPAVLARAAAAIHRAARRVIWLNPLKGDPRYAPTARGMAAALPHVDHFEAAHNLESLERIIPLLGV